MAEPNPSPSSADPRSGFCAESRTFHSLRSPDPLPPPSLLLLSFPSFAFSFLPSPLPSYPAFIDPSAHDSISYSSFLYNVRSLSSALRSIISKGEVALVVSPPRLDLPVLFFSLLSLGAVVSPANPVSTPSELSHLVQLSSPSLAFATSSTAPKLPPDLPVLLLDSPHFESLRTTGADSEIGIAEEIRQSDTAAILYSSGTTGRVKGVVLSHRNLIAQVAPFAKKPAAVVMITVPLFHLYGFLFCLKSVAAISTAAISTARFDARRTLEAISRFGVTQLALAPPGVLALVTAREEEQASAAAEESRHDVSSLETACCGGAPIGIDLIRRFLAAFPHVRFAQFCLPLVWKGYGMTESTSGVFRSEEPEESERLGSVGRLVWGSEAKIVDPTTGIALSPGMQGELWIRGTTIMQGYKTKSLTRLMVYFGETLGALQYEGADEINVFIQKENTDLVSAFLINPESISLLGYIGDEKSTSAILDSNGWLKTGDLCYIDEDGFLFIVDRLKELIKYKGYQVPPAELEHLLQTHPDIVEAAVVPYPDEQAGQIPVAFVIRQPHSILNEAQIMEFVAKQVSPYKKIRRVIFVNSIPKNAAGKILRKDLMNLAFPAINSKM